MIHFTSKTYQMKREILTFSTNFSRRLPKPEKKFMADINYGILASGSCLLTDVIHQLHEPSKKINGVDRLSRHLAKGIPKNALNAYLAHIKKWSAAHPVIHIDDSDIPSAEVKAYYVKETSYYDQKTASFHTKVLALCPIMTRNDDFGDVGNKYPLFWVKYDDLAPFLAKQQLMTSNVNNAAVMSAEDYFTKNLYQGKIYKTNNMQGNTLAQYCPSDTAMAKEQKRIEAELAAFEKNIWGNQARKDSLDSIAKAEKNMDAKTLKKSRNRRSGSASKPAKTSTVKKRRSGGSNVSSGGSARVTVRRERH